MLQMLHILNHSSKKISKVLLYSMLINFPFVAVG